MDGSQLPPERPGGGRGILMGILLLAVIALLLGWAYLASPLGAPAPSATGTPATAP
jgi:hypothetical protein